MIDASSIRYRWEKVGRNLDERGQRLFAANEVRAAGRGGLKLFPELPGSPVPRSIAVRTISTASRWTLAASDARAVAAKPSLPRTRALFRHSSRSLIRSRVAIQCDL
jgi:hypothetical protein